MKTAKTVRSFLFVVVGMLMMISLVQATKPPCQNHKIEATGVGQLLGEDNTFEQISDGGLLQGTRTGHLECIDCSSFPVLTFSAAVTFTSNLGTLTAIVTGTFDQSTGVYSQSGPVTGGTGRLAGASGTLTFDGVVDSNGTFVETIIGNICVNLRP